MKSTPCAGITGNKEATMEISRTKTLLSVILKAIVAVSAFLGVGLCFGASSDTFMGGFTMLLYFTIQSNLWIGLTCLVGALLLLPCLWGGRPRLRPWMWVLKLVFTVAITLTGFVFCFVLAPTIDGAFTLPNVLTHVVVPLGSIIDFFVYEARFPFTGKAPLFCAIPPLWYLGFASVGYLRGWNFGGGAHYPYFFMNWGSPAGAFGFSRELPFLGVFWWILLIAGFVIGIGMLYVRIGKRMQKH